MNATPALQALADAEAKLQAAHEEMLQLKAALDAKTTEVHQLKYSVSPFAEAVLAEQGISALANPMVAAQAARAFRVRTANQENFRNMVRGILPNSDSPAVTLRFTDDYSNGLILSVMLTGQDVSIPFPQEMPAIFDALSAADKKFRIEFSTQRTINSYEDADWEVSIQSGALTNPDTPYLVRSGYNNQRFTTFEEAMSAALEILSDRYRPAIPTTGNIQVSYGS